MPEELWWSVYMLSVLCAVYVMMLLLVLVFGVFGHMETGGARGVTSSLLFSVLSAGFGCF